MRLPSRDLLPTSATGDRTPLPPTPQPQPLPGSPALTHRGLRVSSPVAAAPRRTPRASCASPPPAPRRPPPARPPRGRGNQHPNHLAAAPGANSPIGARREAPVERAAQSVAARGPGTAPASSRPGASALRLKGPEGSSLPTEGVATPAGDPQCPGPRRRFPSLKRPPLSAPQLAPPSSSGGSSSSSSGKPSQTTRDSPNPWRAVATLAGHPTPLTRVQAALMRRGFHPQCAGQSLFRSVVAVSVSE